MEAMGIDIGGSGIKGAVVDTLTGTMITDRKRLPTPEGASPDKVAAVIKDLVRQFGWKGLIGCGFPGVVRGGVALSAANLNKKFVGLSIADLFSTATGCPVVALNDADAAGLAEMRFGAGEGQQGVVLVVTLGTGIGSAIFVDGKLVPNTEFGHLQIRGKDAEWRASDATRQRKELTWKQWAKRLQEFFDEMEKLFSPELIIIGGGVSKNADQFLPLLNLKARVVPAQLLNQAGIIGAALYATGYNNS